MLLCKQDNVSADMYIIIATIQDTCLAVTMLCYSAMSLKKSKIALTAAQISCAYMATHLTYFRLPSIAIPPSFVNLIANFVQS